MINTIFPLVVWFTWWAALGQINGLTHPRDVDPGSYTSMEAILVTDFPPVTDGLDLWVEVQQ